MKKSRFAVIAAAGFRALCFALFTAACASWAAPAVAGTIYTFTADAAGTRTQLHPITQLPIAPFTTPFSGGIELTFTGNGSNFNLLGLALISPISSGTFLPQGGNLGSIILPPDTYFAVGIGPNVGRAAFGTYDSVLQDFEAFLSFAGAGLDTYDGVSSLAPVPVTVDEFDPFRTTRLGNLVGWNFSGSEDITNAKFSAITAVPEPTTLALFGAGFAGVAAMRRRRKASKAA
jgi:hypothetical protein